MSDALRLGVLDFGDLDPLDVAPKAEALGYSRFWLAEHHDGLGHYTDPLQMSALVGAVTDTIRVGPAGVLIRFHSPLAIAEATRSLERVFPGRIDLGVAFGSALPLYRDALLDGRSDSTPADLERRTREVLSYLRDETPAVAVPFHHGLTPLWMLGSSRASAERAGALGAAFCVSMIHQPTAPDTETLDAYRAAFRPSREVTRPLCAILVSGKCVTDSEPVAHPQAPRSLHIRVTFQCGSDQARHELLGLRDRYRADEVVVLELSTDLDARLRSLELIAKSCGLAPRPE